MADIKEKSSNNFTWGIEDTYSGVILQSETKASGAKTKELLDKDGEVKALAVYDKHETISLSGLVAQTNSPMIDVGDEFTVNGKKYICTSCDIAWSNEDVSKINLSGRTYPSITTSGNNS